MNFLFCTGYLLILAYFFFSPQTLLIWLFSNIQSLSISPIKVKIDLASFVEGEIIDRIR
jgi:hypothetical protein